MDGVSSVFVDLGFVNVAILLIIGLATLIMIRVAYVINWTRKPRWSRPLRPLSTMIVLGSAEMINLLGVLQMDRFKPRFYIAAATDNMSLQKASIPENSLLDKVIAGSPIFERGKFLVYGQIRCALIFFIILIAEPVKDEVVGTSHFMQIYRSREVGQSYITSIGTTLIAFTHALWLMFSIRPQVIICNGPGTYIPLCIIAFLFKVFGIRWSSIFYIESIARVRRLSLSGLLLYKLRMADQLFVQWPQLKKKYPRFNYVGRLM